MFIICFWFLTTCRLAGSFTGVNNHFVLDLNVIIQMYFCCLYHHRFIVYCNFKSCCVQQSYTYFIRKCHLIKTICSCTTFFVIGGIISFKDVIACSNPGSCGLLINLHSAFLHLSITSATSQFTHVISTRRRTNVWVSVHTPPATSRSDNCLRCANNMVADTGTGTPTSRTEQDSRKG